MQNSHSTHSTPAPRVGGPARGRFTIAALAIAVAAGIAAAQFWPDAGASARPGAEANLNANARVAAPIELLSQDTAVATEGEVRQSLALTGTLTPLHRIDVKSPLAGQVVSVRVREGDPVRKGQVLATLDPSDLQARLRDREAALEGGQSQLALATKTRENNQALLARNFISQAAFDNVQGSFRNAEATVKSLQAQVEQARKALSDAVIHSPIDGVVAERVAQPGLSVPVNAALLSVHDMSQMELEVLVPTNQIPSVRVGQNASFRIEGFGDRGFEGKVERISPSAAAGSRAIAVYLRIANPDRQLRGGMFAQGSIVVDRSERVVLIPASAVRNESERPHVLKIANGLITEQAVTLGRHDDNGALIVVQTGLHAGDTVVVSNAPNVKAGLQVKVLAPAARTERPAAPLRG